ncbi:MAG: fibro-slime domain-containing protein [Myxococcales bacterium]
MNRYGPRGEPWKDAQGQREYDGNPLFFPIDDAPNAWPDMRYPAKIPEQYGYNGWPWESSIHPDAPKHNFSFTTEVVYWFRYEASANAKLEFAGDDDVWVFVNGQLAVDLGGVHVPESGSVTLDPSTAQRFGLQNGKVYEIRVFHAERKMEGSSFKLTLAGFNMQRSECRPVCGDGEVQMGEDCDDGNRNDGDGCPADCLAPIL